jgi:cytochrome P450
VPLPTMVIAEMLGVPTEDLPRYKRWSDDVLMLSYSLLRDDAGTASVEVYRRVTQEMREALPEWLDARRSVPRDDLLSRLANAEVEGERLTNDEILGFFQLLLVAGQETTANLINNAMICFLEYPDPLAKLRAQPELLPSAIEEVMRYRAPLQWVMRKPVRDIEMNGKTIPAGKLVVPVIGSANRDPGRFDDPERFDNTRDPNPHITFGHGIHHCMGAPLARLESRIALGDLLSRYSHFEHASDHPWPPRKALHVHGPASLPLRFAV